MQDCIQDLLNDIRFNPKRLSFLEMYCYIGDKKKSELLAREIRFKYYCKMVCKYLYKPKEVEKIEIKPIPKKIEKIKLTLSDLYRIAEYETA